MKNQPEVGRLLTDLFDDLQRGVVLWQIAIIGLSLLIAWQAARYLRRRLAATTVAADPERTMRISVGGMNRELFPVTALLLLLLGRWMLEYSQPLHLLNIAVPLVLAMVIIRTSGTAILSRWTGWLYSSIQRPSSRSRSAASPSTYSISPFRWSLRW